MDSVWKFGNVSSREKAFIFFSSSEETERPKLCLHLLKSVWKNLNEIFPRSVGEWENGHVISFGDRKTAFVLWGGGGRNLRKWEGFLQRLRADGEKSVDRGKRRERCLRFSKCDETKSRMTSEVCRRAEGEVNVRTYNDRWVRRREVLF